MVMRPSKDAICKGIMAAWQAKSNTVKDTGSEQEYRREHGRIAQEYGNQCLANGCIDDGLWLLQGAAGDFNTSGDKDEARAIRDQINAVVKRLERR